MKGIFLGSLFSMVSGFVLMVPLGMLFDSMNWPLFHSWGLIHGSFLIAWPLLTFITFAAVQIAMVKKRPAVTGVLTAFSTGLVAAVLVGVVVAVAATVTFNRLGPMVAEESAMSHLTSALLILTTLAVLILNLTFAITFRWTIEYLNSSK